MKYAVVVAVQCYMYIPAQEHWVETRHFLHFKTDISLALPIALNGNFGFKKKSLATKKDQDTKKGAKCVKMKTVTER